MKPLTLLFVCLICAAQGAARAQEAAAAAVAAAQDPGRTPPGVVLVKLKWSREIQSPRGWDRAPYDASVGNTGQPFPSEQRYPAPSSPFPRGGRLPYVYHYTAKIRNEGAKEIKALLWEYVVSDPGSKRELGRHQFFNSERISEREEATLRGRSTSEPSKVVTAEGLGRDKRSPFDERFEIRCLVYADGTLWMHPAAGRFECLGVVRRDRMRRGRDPR